MNIVEFTAIAGLCAALAGVLGALTGLGGGVILTPILTLVLGIDLRYAIGASLIAVIATSSGAAIAYVREGYSNIRIGMFLEVATTLGAVVGSSVTALAPTRAIAILFGIVMLTSVYFTNRPHQADSPVLHANPLSTYLRLNGSYPTSDGDMMYRAQRVPGGFMVMLLAGILSGLLGIGSGALKVLAMDQVMQLPFKVSTTTSNFMIGVTAAASAGMYLSRGYIDPGLCFPVLLGVLLGAWYGAKLLAHVKTGPLRLLFSLLILAIAIEMIYQGIIGRL